MPDNVFEFQSSDFGLILYVDELDSLPIKNFKLCLRILRDHPEDLERLETALRRSQVQAEGAYRDAFKAFVDGYRAINTRSRKKHVLQIRKENRKLKSNLHVAKARFEKFSERLTLIQNQ